MKDDKEKKSKGGRPKGKSPVSGLKVTLVLADNGRLTSRQEIITANTIIMYKGDIKKTCKFLNLPQETVSEVYIKYSSTINQALAKNLNDDKMNKAINESIDIMEGHIKEIKKAQGNSSSKVLNSRAMDAFLPTVDRLVKVKDASTDAYFKCLSTLNESVMKAKLTEKTEEGLDYDNGIYGRNQKAVVDLLTDNESRGVKVCATSSNKACEAKDLSTGEIHEYSSIEEFLSEIGCIRKELDNLVDDHKSNPNSRVILKGRWEYLGPVDSIKIEGIRASVNETKKK